MKTRFWRYLVILTVLNVATYGFNDWALHSFIYPMQQEHLTVAVQESANAIRDRVRSLDGEQRKLTAEEMGHKMGVLVEFWLPEEEGVPDWVKQQFQTQPWYGIAIDSMAGVGYVHFEKPEQIMKLGPFHTVLVDSADSLFFVLFTTMLYGTALWFLVRNGETRVAAIHELARQQMDTGKSVEIFDPQHDIIGTTACTVGQMARELARNIREKQQSLEQQRDLMHAVAHEFRSPMARLTFALDMVAPDIPAGQAELVAEMQSSLEDLETLVREVLSYSRLQHGPPGLSPGKCTLYATVNTMVAQVKTLYPSVSFSTAGENRQPRSVYVDERLLKRVLINLLRNAARFARTEVEVNWRREEDRFVLEVHDDGPGIPPGKRRRIFEPFTRLDASRSRDSGGAGLGLAIVKSICDQHRGSITVGDSGLGGAVFSLNWPISLDTA